MAKNSVGEVQEAIRRGPITREYKADMEHVVRALNSLRSTEIMSYLQYMQHQYMASKAANVGVAPEQGTTLAEMVTEDLILERQQIEAYTALIREIGDQDLVTRQVLLSILIETEKHASELADYLKRSPNQ